MFPKQKEPTPKRVSRKTLENQLSGARELIHRLAVRCTERAKTIELYEQRLFMASAYIGYLVSQLDKELECNAVLIPKSEITRFIQTKSIEAKESEDKEHILITVSEVNNADEETGSNPNDEKGVVDARAGEVSDSDGREQVQECQNDSGEQTVPFTERSKTLH